MMFCQICVPKLMEGLYALLTACEEQLQSNGKLVAPEKATHVWQGSVL